MWRNLFRALTGPASIFGLAMMSAGLAFAQSGEVDAVLRANQAATGAPPAHATTITITYAFTGMGLHGSYVSTDDLLDGRFVNTLAVGPISQIQGFDGDHAWLKDASGVVTQQAGGDQHQTAVSEAYRQANLWWRSDRGGAQIVAEGVRRDDGAAYDVLTVTPKGGKTFEAWFDVDTHLFSRLMTTQGAGFVSNTFLDYHRFEGVLQAKKVVIGDESGLATQTLTVTKVEYADSSAARSFSAPGGEANDASISGGRRETSVPFRLVDNRVYADIRLKGEGPFLFQFDTGAMDCVTSTLADRLRLTAQGHAQERGAGEGVAESGYAKIQDVEIADARINDQIFKVGGDALKDVEGLNDEGIIGSELFHRFITRIDYPRGVITLIDPKMFDAKDAGTPVRFDFVGNLIEIAGAFEGIPARLVVDTGSRAELVINKPFAERNGLESRHPKGVDVVAGWGTGGPSRAYATRGGTLGVGPIQVQDVVTFLSTDAKGAFAGSDFDGEIGGGVLKRFAVTFDYRHQVMYWKPAQRTPSDVGTFDRAGMWFNRSPSGLAIVAVAAGTPAAQAGLTAGDQIVSVDGLSARTMNVYDLRSRLRNAPPGTRVRFVVLRHGRPKKSIVTLQDLI
jgi:hypothetical protein